MANSVKSEKDKILAREHRREIEDARTEHSGHRIQVPQVPPELSTLSQTTTPTHQGGNETYAN